MGGHTESIRIQYDSRETSYEEMLSWFWSLGSAAHPSMSTQYKSAVWCLDQAQLLAAHASAPSSHHADIRVVHSWTPAEDYHQKYFLRRHTSLLAELGLDDDLLLRRSRLAAVLNAAAAGSDVSAVLDAAIASHPLPLSPKARTLIQRMCTSGRRAFLCS